MQEPFTNDNDVSKIDQPKLDNPLTEEIDMSDVAKKSATPRTREIPEGYIGLAQLAKEVGMTPANLRRKLRTMGATKPEGSFAWAWKEDSEELDKLRKELAKGE